MFGIRKAAVFLLASCLIPCAFAETVELQVANTPVKGQILLEKKGLSDDGHELPLSEAVFKICAAEDITGGDGTIWFEAGEQAALVTTGADGTAESPLLPLGRYEVIETVAPEGYVPDETVHEVTLESQDHVTPVVTYTISVTDCENEVLLKKTDPDGYALQGAEFDLFDENHRKIMTAVSDADGLVRFHVVPDGSYTIRETAAPDGYLLCTETVQLTMNRDWRNTSELLAVLTDQPKRMNCIKTDPDGNPISGAAFILISSETGEAVQTAISGADGTFAFTQFDYGDWIIRETKTPDGYNRMDDITVHVGEEWDASQVIRCVDIPDHYEFTKVNSDGKALEGAKFSLEDEDGNVLDTAESDEDGLVSFEGLEPGTYIIRETKAPDGYALSGKTVRVEIDEDYTIPDDLPEFVNYTEIQTGVGLAFTSVTCIGLGMMAGSIILRIVAHRKRKKGKERA